MKVFPALFVFLVAAVACAPAATEEPAATPEATTPEAADPQAELIASAESAGPASIAADASVLDWDLNVIRAGSNGWTCLPDRPNTPGNDPWCVNDAWVDFLNAYIAGTEPTYTEVGFAYMLQGDTPVSNSDPYATEETSPEDWVTDLGAHLMILLPDKSLLASFPTDHLNGGPWVMWPDTPYAHLMVPIDSR